MLKLKCKNNLPHQFRIVKEFQNAQYEVCELCGYKIRMKKDSKGRTDNLEYLRLHKRDTVQPHGATKHLYMKIYHPKYCIVRLCLNKECNQSRFCIHKSIVRQQLHIDHRVKPKPGTTYWDSKY